ncbi:MAG: hypothetical protein ABIR06_14430 [Cyclobacteriaceae bacterium]
MKKIFLTGCAAALFCVAAMAQDRDTTQNQSNEFRNTEQQQQQTNPAQEAVDSTADSTATDFQQGVNETEREAEQAGENIRQESQNLRNDAEKTGEKIEQGAEEASDDLNKGLNRAGDKQTKERMEQSPDGKKGQMKDNAENKMNEQATANTGGSELEVVEAKEGPQNEVVYKYQGELFYIDRVEKKLVKAEESVLKDAKHQVIIKENMNSTESAQENTKRRKANN